MSKNTKQMAGLQSGRVINPNKRRTMKLFCCQCDKTIIPKDGNVVFKRCLDGSIDFICDQCNDKHNKHWNLKSAIIIPDEHNYGMTGISRCTFEDGRTEDIMYGWNSGENSEMPDQFYESLKKFRQAYHEEKQSRLIKSFEIVDNWDEQKITIEQNSGVITILNFKVGTGGLIFDQREIAKVDAELLAGIKDRLKGQGLAIGGTK